MSEKIIQGGFDHHLPYEVIEHDEQHAILKVELQDFHKNLYGYVHGGVYFSYGDITCGHIAKAATGTWVTLNGTINYIKAIKAGVMFVEGTLLSSSRKTKVIEVVCKDEEGLILAKSTYTMYKIS